MTGRLIRLTTSTLLFLLFATRVEALQVRSVEFIGLDELQVLNVRSELSLAEAQLDPASVISENRLDYLMRLAPREPSASVAEVALAH